MALATAMAATTARPAGAQITWNWSFGPYAGQFVTNGSAPGGVAPAATYDFSDFSVTAGPVANLGSVSGGQYVPDGFGTFLPYTMTWNGSDVTDWFPGGSNGFHWWVFNDVAQNNEFVFFGWQTGNVNDIHQAAYYNEALGCCNQPSFQLTVTPTAGGTVAPEPATCALLSTGLVGLAAFARRRRA